MTYDQAVAMCRDLGIPEDDIDDVVESAELCNCGDEGPCAENSKGIIRVAAKRYFSDEIEGDRMNELTAKISALLDDKQAWTEDEDGTWMRHNSGLILNVSEKQFLRVARPASVTLSEETKDALWPKVEAIIGTLDERRAKRNALNTEKVLDALASHFEVKELVATGQCPF